MPNITVTQHAAIRYVERVNPRATIAEASDAILSARRGIEAAASFGCRVIRLGCGAKLILRESRVVTVLAPCKPWSGHQWGMIQ